MGTDLVDCFPFIGLIQTWPAGLLVPVEGRRGTGKVTGFGDRESSG